MLNRNIYIDYTQSKGHGHEPDREDVANECENATETGKSDKYFTRYDYHSIMGYGSKCNEANLEGAEDITIPIRGAPAGSTYDIIDIMSRMEGLGKCDRNTFKEMAESQTCGSRGPLPFKYPFLETRRCDMQFDCPYEDIGAPSYKVDEGEQCMDECM